jgi:hypothetical protein
MEAYREFTDFFYLLTVDVTEVLEQNYLEGVSVGVSFFDPRPHLHTYIPSPHPQLTPSPSPSKIRSSLQYHENLYIYIYKRKYPALPEEIQHLMHGTSGNVSLTVSYKLLILGVAKCARISFDWSTN